MHGRDTGVTQRRVSLSCATSEQRKTRILRAFSLSAQHPLTLTIANLHPWRRSTSMCPGQTVGKTSKREPRTRAAPDASTGSILRITEPHFRGSTKAAGNASGPTRPC